MSGSFRAVGARARHNALRTFLLACAALAGSSLLLAACSGRTLRATGAAPAARHLALNGHAAAPMPNAGGAAIPGYGTSDKAAGSRAARTHFVLSSQSIIYTAFLGVRVSKDVAGVATKAATIVTAAGGYVSGEQETIPQNKHNAAVVNLQLKIPVAQYTTTLSTLRTTLGKQLSFRQVTQDVTQQVADVNSRVASSEAAITQLRALLKHAGSVSQLLSVQQEINSQESYLEALLAQQRALAHETSYATLSITLYGHHAHIVKKHHKASPGFGAGLRGGWHALGLVVGWFLTALGSALPFLILAALIGAIAWESRRRLGRRKAPPAAEPPATAAP
jgi:uncharacterized protein DUF4349